MNNPPYEEDSLEVRSPNDCHHIGCHCLATAEGFCCPNCKSADTRGAFELSCNCGHKDCLGDFFSDRPLRSANF
ncbi:MAG: hypothetical protein K2Y39_08155 [Candidatus Obscuribacterales bacterium]|nr:hypothetical protein [Candidatus Obscuribacterales bacterium]